MAKFKIGDKVRLKAGILPDNTDRIFNNLELPCEIITDILKFPYVTVKKIDNTDNTVLITVTKTDWWIGEDALEIYQEQPYIYQIGDIVRIKKREGNDYDYPFTFSDNMKELAGALCMITKIIPNQVDADQEYKYFNGDYSYYKLEPLDSSDKRDFAYIWHSLMFEPVAKPQKIQLQATSLKKGDLVPICGILGKIEFGANNYYLEFDDILDQEHISCCKKLRELVPNFDKIADEFGTVYNTGRLFPEFRTIDELIRFVRVINTEYNSKQSTILKKSETYEIRFQKPKTSSIRGSVPTGRAICGRRYKTAIELGHLSNTTCYC